MSILRTIISFPLFEMFELAEDDTAFCQEFQLHVGTHFKKNYKSDVTFNKKASSELNVLLFPINKKLRVMLSPFGNVQINRKIIDDPHLYRLQF